MSDDWADQLSAKAAIINLSEKSETALMLVAAELIKAMAARLTQRDAALKAADDLLEAVTHDREMVCQDYDMQFKASQSVERCLDAYRKARGAGCAAQQKLTAINPKL